jgi:hypothetical protein
MAKFTKDSVECHVQSLRESGGLPFQALLSGERIQAALERAGVKFRERIFGPAVTLWVFLSQVLAADKSCCVDAVSRLLAYRLACGKSGCSTDSSSYCQARIRLPLEVVCELTREVGRKLHQATCPEWQWKSRNVVIIDGSTATMPDTEKNQQAFPQSRNQKAGLGFPILRMVVLLSYSMGTVLDCAVGACRGKKTGEQSLFRTLWDALQPGDVALADRLYDCYRDVVFLKQERQVDCVFGSKNSRVIDFRRGRKLGPDDHLVYWRRPKFDSNRFASKDEWERLPAEFEMRELRVIVRRPGFKTRHVVVVTTLLDPLAYSKEDIANLFAGRWHCELDLRSIKRSLGMHHLTCKTPELVKKEMWVHFLAYNLIRVRMAQAAAIHCKVPRELSFTCARNHIDNFAPYMNMASPEDFQQYEMQLLKAIATHAVGNRPGRKEPRAVKKRQGKFPTLKKPRDQARKGLPA